MPFSYFQNELLGLHVDVSAPSIFAKVALSSASDISSFYVFNNPNASSKSQVAWITSCLVLFVFRFANSACRGEHVGGAGRRSFICVFVPIGGVVAGAAVTDWAQQLG